MQRTVEAHVDVFIEEPVDVGQAVGAEGRAASRPGRWHLRRRKDAEQHGVILTAAPEHNRVKKQYRYGTDYGQSQISPRIKRTKLYHCWTKWRKFKTCRLVKIFNTFFTFLFHQNTLKPKNLEGSGTSKVEARTQLKIRAIARLQYSISDGTAACP